MRGEMGAGWQTVGDEGTAARGGTGRGTKPGSASTGQGESQKAGGLEAR